MTDPSRTSESHTPEAFQTTRNKNVISCTVTKTVTGILTQTTNTGPPTGEEKGIHNVILTCTLDTYII